MQTETRIKVDLAKHHGIRIESWYRSLGFTSVVVPKPKVSNMEFQKSSRYFQALFYRPPTSLVSYEAFMKAVGQVNHWTVINKAKRDQIGWESTVKGYWFWAEVERLRPHSEISWKDLRGTIRLLTLEEYVIVWHATKAATSILLDPYGRCGLSTRFGFSVLEASGNNDEFQVHDGRGFFEIPSPAFDGFRLAEVV